MRKFYSLFLFIFFLFISCKTKNANPKTPFFDFLKGRSISGPTEIWHMKIKEKNLYFFSDFHESKDGACSNCSGPTCASIGDTFAHYFMKPHTSSHFFIESNFQVKGYSSRDSKLNPAFLSETIDTFQDCLEDSGKKDPKKNPPPSASFKANCIDKYPKTFFHYADIRNSLPVLTTISYLGDIRSVLKKNTTTVNRATIQQFVQAKKTILTQFKNKKNLKSFLDIFVYEKNFSEAYLNLGFTKPASSGPLATVSDKYYETYTRKPHKIAKQLRILSSKNKKILEEYYEEKTAKFFQSYLPDYDTAFQALKTDPSTKVDLIEDPNLEKFSTLIFWQNYVLSNVYALGRMLRFLEDPTDQKDFVLYWGAAHIHDFLEFFSKYYKVPIKPVQSTRLDKRCIQVH